MARALDTWDGSKWAPAKVLSVNDGTAWQPAKGAWVYDGAAWQQFWPVAPPVKPSLAYTGNGLFIIQNYDPAVVYAAVGGVQAGNEFIVGNDNGDATLTPAWYVGGPTGPAAGAHRRRITYRNEWVQTSYQVTPGRSGPFGGSGHNATVSCTYDPGTDSTGCSYGYSQTVKNTPPAGYTEQFGEWWKVD